MKIRATGFSVNGRGELRGLLAAIDDDGETPLGIEQSGNWSDYKTIAQYKRALVDGLHVSDDRAIAAITKALVEARRKVGWEGAEPETSRSSQADRLVRLGRDTDAVWFVDEVGEPHVAINGDGTVVHPINSRKTRRWLAGLIYAAEEHAPTGEAMAAAVLTLEAHAEASGERYDLDVRVARQGSTVWYDLGRAAVRIVPGSWEVVEHPPILFRRFGHQRPQVTPVHGGKFEELHSFLPVKADDQLLSDVVMISDLVPGSPRVINVFHGPEGSGKTTAARIFVRLVDPSIAPTIRRIPRPDELAQRLAQGWLIGFDNLSSLPEWVQDQISAAVTGDADFRRALFTTADSSVMAFRRAIVLTGIEVPLTRPDAIDRAVLIGLERIAEENVRDEEELWPAFDAVLPSILGGAFDILARALAKLPDVHLDTHPRMADFARLGYAIAECIQNGGGKAFLTAYKTNTATRHEEILASSTVAQVLLQVLETQGGSWRGRPIALKHMLDEAAPPLGIDPKNRNVWPQDLSQLGTVLAQLAVTLARHGTVFSQLMVKGNREYQFVPVGKDMSRPSPPPSGEASHGDHLDEGGGESAPSTPRAEAPQGTPPAGPPAGTRPSPGPPAQDGGGGVKLPIPTDGPLPPCPTCGRVDWVYGKGDELLCGVCEPGKAGARP